MLHLTALSPLHIPVPYPSIRLLSVDHHHFLRISLDVRLSHLFLPVCRIHLFHGYIDSFLRASPCFQEQLIYLLDDLFLGLFILRICFYSYIVTSLFILLYQSIRKTAVNQCGVLPLPFTADAITFLHLRYIRTFPSAPPHTADAPQLIQDSQKGNRRKAHWEVLPA